MRAADVEQRERKLQAPWAKVMGWPVGSRVRAQATQSGLWEEGGAAGEWGAAGSSRASRERRPQAQGSAQSTVTQGQSWKPPCRNLGSRTLLTHSPSCPLWTLSHLTPVQVNSGSCLDGSREVQKPHHSPEGSVWPSPGHAHPSFSPSHPVPLPPLPSPPPRTSSTLASPPRTAGVLQGLASFCSRGGHAWGASCHFSQTPDSTSRLTPLILQDSAHRASSCLLAVQHSRDPGSFSS